jgi:hypothetical protein
MRKIQAVLAILWLNLALAAWAQNTTGSIVGTITCLAAERPGNDCARGDGRQPSGDDQ